MWKCPGSTTCKCGHQHSKSTEQEQYKKKVMHTALPDCCFCALSVLRLFASRMIYLPSESCCKHVKAYAQGVCIVNLYCEGDYLHCAGGAGGNSCVQAVPANQASSAPQHHSCFASSSTSRSEDFCQQGTVCRPVPHPLVLQVCESES